MKKSAKSTRTASTAVLADALKGAGFTVRTATLDEPEHGLTEQVLAETDVLTWWGHMAHGEVKDEIARPRGQTRPRRHGPDRAALRPHVETLPALDGHLRRPQMARSRRKRAPVGASTPATPSPQACPNTFDLPHEEMYGEHFDIPAPDELVFVSWFKGGEVFRSGCCWTRGAGKVFYFRPGHETFPTYYQKEVQQVIINAVEVGCAPATWPCRSPTGHKPNPLEKVD